MSLISQFSRRIEFAGSTIEILSEDVRSANIIEFIARHSSWVTSSDRQNSTVPESKYELRPSQRGNGIDLFFGEELELENVPDGEIALYLIGQICYRFAYACRSGIMLHAGMVSKQGRAILLPGTTGKGKTTLSAYFLTQGFDYHTDELAFIPDGDVVGFGYNRPLCIKTSRNPILESYFNLSNQDPDVIHTPMVYLVRPEKFGAEKAVSSAKLSMIIFPNYQENAIFQLQQLSAAKAGFQLMQCLINARNLTEYGFSQVAQISRSIPAYQMIYGDFQSIESLIISQFFTGSKSPDFL